MPAISTPEQATMLRDHVLDLERVAKSSQIISGSRYVITDMSKLRLTSPFEKAMVEEPVSLRAILDWLNEQSAPPPTPPPPTLLDRITIDTGPIVFDNGVPVNGWAHADLFPDGNFSFSGHFHVSGAPSYNVSFALVIRGSNGTAFTLAKEGRLHGFFEPGSRDFDWGDNGSNPALKTAWAELSAGYAYHWNAAVNLDIGPIVDAALKAIGSVGPIVAVIALL